MGLCRACYRRDKNQGFHCTQGKCISPVFALTLCQRHYMQWQTRCLLCSNRVHYRYLCRSHYRIARRDNSFLPAPECIKCGVKQYLNGLCIRHFKSQYNNCMMVGCENKAHKRGLCCSHYFKQRRMNSKHPRCN